MRQLLALLVLSGACYAQRYTKPVLITQHARLDELLTGYNRWQDKHPEQFGRGHSLKLPMPSVDFYSPSGELIYYGHDSQSNATFLRTLRGSQNFATKPQKDVLRPTLEEAIGMFPELSNQHVILPNTYTLVALTYADDTMCGAQNRAIKELAQGLYPLHVRVIQIFLDYSAS